MSGSYCSSMDLRSGCGTIAWPMSAVRSICMFVLVGLCAFGAADAHAHVFKPRGNLKPGATARATASTSTAPTTTPAAARKTASAATPTTASTKKSTRSAAEPTPRRSGSAKKSRRGKGKADDPVVIDDDDDDVKITDD